MLYKKFLLRKYLDLVRKEIHLLLVSLFRIHSVIGFMKPTQDFHSQARELVVGKIDPNHIFPAYAALRQLLHGGLP